MTIRDVRLVERIERLLEIPKLIDTEGKKRVALTAERRTVERLIQAREAAVLRDLMVAEAYRACKNADERAALLEDAKHRDDIHGEKGWPELQKRLDQILLTIDKCRHNENVLDHERKALKAALEREYAEIIERALTDRMLAEAVAGRRRTAA